ncbi:DUF4082 domain-containing protein [Cryobacterium sp. N22]|uniref:DUF4082 domain-containing protein n=1 Tax=Cryobacterium sp. N22 TaxID=2048290 RepID=UPI000CE3DCCF|nr:DUF4082 domain-containing protein [Cryobacterium sp. N22]
MTVESTPRRTSRRQRGLVVVAVIGLIGVAIALFLVTVTAAGEGDAEGTGAGAAGAAGPVSEPESTIFGSQEPATADSEDARSVELGVRFTSAVGGSVTGIRFFKSTLNTGTHSGSLWTVEGERLASVTFEAESASGWQTASFADPVTISPGTTYVASYLAPEGHYASDPGAFTEETVSAHLRVPVDGGLFEYGSGGFPTQTHDQTNYYVDVLFRADQVVTAEPAGALNLPMIPWEGGPAYWKQFSKADAAGWDDPDFFPMLSWWGNVASDAEVAYDKSLGINTYSEMWPETPYSLFEENDVFWVGTALNDTFIPDSPNWVGYLLDDEVDGRFTVPEGQARLQGFSDDAAGNGWFRYANFTKMVVETDMDKAAAEQYVNGYTDAVSVDMYWYTVPYCDWTPYRDVYLVPIDQANCRTSSSYGKVMDSLRLRDAADGTLQPLWQWVENLNGGPGDGAPSAYIAAGQLKGAVMNSIINEARGIAYFNQSFSGPCRSSNVFRDSQNEGFCGAEQVAAVKEVNATVHSLARVINTQSYDYSFGAGLDTMLKSSGDFAYIFAMVDGSSTPGSRTFQLPESVAGRDVEVLEEDRTLDVDGSGRFTDSFDEEYSYHVYRIAID